jgi:hypothetical protein
MTQSGHSSGLDAIRQRVRIRVAIHALPALNIANAD